MIFRDIRPTHCSGQAVSSALPREQLNGDRSLRRLNSRFPLTKSVRAFTLRPIPFDSFRRCVDAGWGYFLDKWTASEWPCSDAAMQREGGPLATRQSALHRHHISDLHTPASVPDTNAISDLHTPTTVSAAPASVERLHQLKACSILRRNKPST